MKNTCTQNRTIESLTKDEHETLDFMVAKLQTIMSNPRPSSAASAASYAQFIYRQVYPRTVAQPRHFTDRQLRVLSAIKAGA
jgi:hypothetical protein